MVIISLDIETVGAARSYDLLNHNQQNDWNHKSSRSFPDEEPRNSYDKAGLFPEHGKIVCISCTVYGKDNTVKTKSYYGHDERQLLLEFTAMAQTLAPGKHKFMGHNIKGFDIPFIIKRMIINGIKLPPMFMISGRKPWELDGYMIDTMELWKFGGRTSTDLGNLCNILGIPSPKDDMDGSMVHTEYWENDNIDGIVEYCEKDTTRNYLVYLKIKDLAGL